MRGIPRTSTPQPPPTTPPRQLQTPVISTVGVPVMASVGKSPSPPRRPPPPPPPPPPRKPRGRPVSAPPAICPPAMCSKYLMNDIPRGTSCTEIIHCLMGPRIGPLVDGLVAPQRVELTITDSRLDDELSVATIQFIDPPPKWLQLLNSDKYGFPKKMAIGTLWRGIKRNQVGEFGRTEYIRAVMNGGLNIIYAEMLAEFEDTNVNVQDNNGRTALHWACAGNHCDMVKLCLSVPECDIGVQDHDGLTAFDIALQNSGSNEVVPNLFYTNILELDESHPQTALLRVLTITSEPANDKSIFPGAAIFDPIMDSNEQLVAALIDRGIDLSVRNKDGDTPLHLAAAREFNIVTRLLEAGSDINARGRWGATPLHHAAFASDKRVVQLLMDSGADITLNDMDGGSALDWAVENKRFDLKQLLMDHGAIPGETSYLGRTAQRLTAQVPKTNLVEPATDVNDKLDQTAVDPVADRNPCTGLTIRGTKSQQGWTLLQMAAVHGDLDTVERLLLSGVDKEAKDVGGRTALHMAVMTGNTDVVKALITDGAEIEAASFGDSTALHHAAREGNLGMAETLLELGADRGAICWNKQTALHLAARKGHTRIVELLVAGLTSVDPRSNDGTPAQLALKYGHADTVEVLLAHGAKRPRAHRANDVLQLLGFKGTT